MQMGFSSSNLGIQLNTSHSTNISFPQKSILKFTWKKTDSQSTKGNAQSINISDYILHFKTIVIKYYDTGIKRHIDQ